MTSSINLSCCVELQQTGDWTDTAIPPLHLVIKLNNQTVWDSDVTGVNEITLPLDDSLEGTSNVLSFEMSGKTDKHTLLDADGNIAKDASITITNIHIDEIELSQVFSERSVYHHNLNGNGEPTQDKFFGTMGCNCRLDFLYSTPFYIWLLENM